MSVFIWKTGIRGMIKISIIDLKEKLIKITAMVCMVLCAILLDNLNVIPQFFENLYLMKNVVNLGNYIAIYFIIKEAGQITENMIQLEIPVPDLLKEIVSFLKNKIR